MNDDIIFSIRASLRVVEFFSINNVVASSTMDILVYAKEMLVATSGRLGCVANNIRS